MNHKGRKDIFSVVPWMNSEQFTKVYSCLYSDSLSKKRWAVDQISVWDTRCYPSLPTAVESTVGLIRAHIHDMLYKVDKTFCQEGDIQMLYSMALIRFVNLTLEHHQNATNKMSLSLLAAQQNIPSWLIDLRNEAVHSYYPSLSMLRAGADSALKYLEETFWAIEPSNIRPKINFPTGQDAAIENVLNLYKGVQFQRLEVEENTRRLNQELKSVLKKISSYLYHDKEKFIDILVKPGNFLAIEDFKKLMDESAKHMIVDTNLTVPPKIERFWFPLLRKIHFSELMPTFLEKLLIAQEKYADKFCHRMAVAWAQQILLGPKHSGLLGKIFKKRALLLNLPGLVYACMKGTTQFSLVLLHAILAKLKSKPEYDSLFELMALYQGYCVPEEDSSSKRKRDQDKELIFCLEDVEEELKDLREKKMRLEKDGNIWSSPSVTMDFSVIPIGGVTSPANLDTTPEDKEDDSWRDLIKLMPTADDNFIIVNKNDGEGTVEEEITHDINTFPVTTRPENFNVVYRKRFNQ